MEDCRDLSGGWMGGGILNAPSVARVPPHEMDAVNNLNEVIRVGKTRVRRGPLDQVA